MEIADLSLLKIGETGLPIEVRVLRKWRPLFRDNETHFILVDKHGNGIQAIAKSKDQQFMEGKLRLLSCYRIEKYACTDPEEYVNTLTHRTNLRIGTSSSTTPLADNEDLPRNYFEFGSHRKIELICGNKKEFTDYIGLLQGIEDKTTNPGHPYVLLKLTDSSNPDIQAAVWDEIARSTERFDRSTIENALKPAVVAITGVKVRSILGEPQLSSINATYVCLNPSTAEATILINRNNREHDHQGEIREERITVSGAITVTTQRQTTIEDLLHKERHEVAGHLFTINASVVHITTAKDWYQAKCPKCNSEMYRATPRWFCTVDG